MQRRIFTRSTFWSSTYADQAWSSYVSVVLIHVVGMTRKNHSHGYRCLLTYLICEFSKPPVDADPSLAPSTLRTSMA